MAGIYKNVQNFTKIKMKTENIKIKAIIQNAIVSGPILSIN